MYWTCHIIPVLVTFYIGECHVAIHPRDFLLHAAEHDNGHGGYVPYNDEVKVEEHWENQKQDHKNVNCVPLVRCPAHIRLAKNSYCTTSGKRKGVICYTGQNHTEQTYEKLRGYHKLHLDTATLGSLQRKSRAGLSKLKSKEAELLASKEYTILLPGSATFGHFRNSRTFDIADLSQVMTVANSALELALATRAFKDRQGLSNEQLELGISNQNLRLTPLGNVCLAAPFCPLIPDKYRRIDGACNNALHPIWGAPFTPYSRILPASYQDGIWIPRVSVVEGEPLASPRLISTTIISDIDAPNHDYTLALMQFGQLISHDITQSMDMSYEHLRDQTGMAGRFNLSNFSLSYTFVKFKLQKCVQFQRHCGSTNGSAISCCESDGTSTLPPEATHYACLPIYIPSKDPFFAHYKQRCMNFVRTILAPKPDCTLGYAEQMNKLTHFIDASSVYGSTPEQISELRSFVGGKLKVMLDFGRELLPASKDPEACLTMEQGSACFQSGDTRTNQMISLVAMHTLFLREHNRLASILAELNPHWNDEQLFLEARQILVAEMQVIIYKEFLPCILGYDTMQEFGLNLEEGPNYSSDYSPLVEPSVTNEFAAAAFRFGHSTVDGQLRVYGPKKMEEIIAIPEIMFYPSRMRHPKFFDEILSTLTTEPIQDVDASLSEMLTKYMFRGGNPFGVDLAAINIQRGRDHGLRPYNDYRELTGLPRISDFNEFGLEVGEKLRSVYKSTDDIDLWVGGLLEEKALGSVVGPTFRDIIADQFARLKKGDRYFFENDPSINPGSFAPEQLLELRKASLSRIICDNSDKLLLSRQAPNAFRKPGVSGNDFLDCRSSEIPSLDLVAWQE